MKKVFYTKRTFLIKKVFDMVKRLIPLAAMEKILKNSEAERVSDKAKIALKNIIEDLAEDIATNSVKLTKHAGRKTVKAGDIKLASKN